MPRLCLSTIVKNGGFHPVFDDRYLSPFFEEFFKCMETMDEIVVRLDHFQAMADAHTARHTVALDRNQIRMLTGNTKCLIRLTEERLRHLVEKRFVEADRLGGFSAQVDVLDKAACEIVGQITALRNALGR